MTFSLFSETFRQNPYKVYKELQSHHPVYWYSLSDKQGFWIVSRFKDIEFVLKSKEFVRSDKTSKDKGDLVNSHEPVSINNVKHKWIVYKDPPEHTKIRNILSQVMTSYSFDNQKDIIEKETIKITSTLKNKFDVISDYAYPLIISIITKILGLPIEPLPLYIEFIQKMTESMDLKGRANNERETIVITNKVLKVIKKSIEQRSHTPKDDLISKLIAATYKKERLTEDDILYNCIFLLGAGSETTVSLIGNSIYTLLKHQDQFDVLRSNINQINNTVEEILRFESPVQFTFRIANQSLKMHGISIKKGEILALALGAANRDPEQFMNPDQFDINRADNNHLAFGSGIHYCLGANLGRLEAAVAIQNIIGKYPELKLIKKKSEWLPLVFIRCLKSLPVIAN